MVATGAALGADAYVCVLKCKQAELDAIDSVAADRFVPLLEVTGSDRAAAISRKWRPGESIWVQPVNANGTDDALWANDTTALFDELRAAGIAAVPAALLDDTPESSAALAKVVATDGRGVVLRLDAEDLVMTPPASVQADIAAFLSYYGLTPADCDLVIDASLVRDSVAARVATVESATAAVPYLPDWRNLVVALSAFPADLGAQMGKDTVQGFDRSDRAAYMSLIARGTSRATVYADFGVGQPTYADVAFSPIPNVKYTDVSEWHVHRGAQRANPSPQYVKISRDLSVAPYFRGSGFSRGDAYLDAVASGSDGPGNATTYLRTAMSHHIAHVLDRLASHGEP
jgi:hypothetical protein